MSGTILDRENNRPIHKAHYQLNIARIKLCPLLCRKIELPSKKQAKKEELNNPVPS